jgi:hypothetical protein
MSHEKKINRDLFVTSSSPAHVHTIKFRIFKLNLNIQRLKYDEIYAYTWKIQNHCVPYFRMIEHKT